MTVRFARAREISGLSLGQAAKLLGVESHELAEFEEGRFSPVRVEALAKLYRVRVEWLTGEAPQHDYAAVDALKGAEKLCADDRDVVAEFAAMLAARTQPKPVDAVRAIHAPGLFDSPCPRGMFCHHEPTCPGAIGSPK